MKYTRIIYPGGTLSGVQRKAVELLSKTVLDETLEVPACIGWEDYATDDNFRDIFIGTKQNNPYIRERSEAILTKPEEYAIAVKNDAVIIEGYDDAGVLYGCADFYPRYVAQKSLTYNSGTYFCHIFADVLPEAFIQSAPAVKNRGLWTWGHVIYDFRGYFDNMAKLKMNTVIIWNDHVPLNAKQLVAYAHDAGIKVIWGFPWLWGLDCSRVDMNSLETASKEIADYYEQNYADLGGDGIYFQSFTELSQETIGGVLIAEAVTKFVNDTAGRIFEKHPGLELQFGLHTDSVRNRLDYIRHVDPRIRIVWENCGCFPFDYMPDQVEGFGETKAYVDRISRLRGEDERFGVVLKGLTKLKWSTFRHQPGPFVLGEASKQMCANRIARKKKIWHFVQAGWMVNGDKVQEMIRLMRDNRRGDLYITALVEDGMFEQMLYYPVALLGEFLWDCETDPKVIAHRVAVRNDVEFV